MTLVTEADGSAEKSAYAYYEPFGRRIERYGAPVGGPPGELRLGLTGHEHDDDLGLINMKGRIYDPKLKRVLTPDPLVSAPLFGQSYNRYSYVLNAEGAAPGARRRARGGRPPAGSAPRRSGRGAVGLGGGEAMPRR